MVYYSGHRNLRGLLASLDEEDDEDYEDDEKGRGTHNFNGKGDNGRFDSLTKEQQEFLSAGFELHFKGSPSADFTWVHFEVVAQ